MKKSTKILLRFAIIFPFLYIIFFFVPQLPMPRMLKFIIIGFITIILLSFLINYYVYSWIGLVLKLVGLCLHKTIGIPYQKQPNQKLKQFYDIPQIAAVVGTMPNYEINCFGSHYLTVTCDFNGVKYNLKFTVYTYSNLLYGERIESKFDLNTFNNFDDYPSSSKVRGESCTTPSYIIKKKVYSMIDDLPLSNSQKAELKQHVRVHYEWNFSLSF